MVVLSQQKDEQIDNLLNQVNLEAEMLYVCEMTEKKQVKKIKRLSLIRNILFCIVGLEGVYIGVQSVLK